MTVQNLDPMGFRWACGPNGTELIHCGTTLRTDERWSDLDIRRIAVAMERAALPIAGAHADHLDTTPHGKRRHFATLRQVVKQRSAA